MSGDSSPPQEAVQRLGDEAPDQVVTGEARWSSDVLADTLRDLGVEFIALNPGSSYRGLHDSLINHLGNEAPQLMLCLHEEHAVAVAHGYGKVTGRPMAVALHSNVGLMHASMAIFNAYCDRVPILLVGATGPLDADRRRPWIDWLHTATDQAALVRPYLKWDDQPLSIAAAVDAILQAHRLASSPPMAPTYVCLDASMQEAELLEPPTRADVRRFAPPAAVAPGEDAVADLAQRLLAADRVVLLMGRTSRSPEGWKQRVELAERLNAAVFTHHKLAAAFPTEHPLHRDVPRVFTGAPLRDALHGADVIVSLDWLDLGGTLRAAGEVPGLVVSVTLDEQLHSGWGKESFTPAPADVRFAAEVDATVSALLRHLPRRRTDAALADTDTDAPVPGTDAARAGPAEHRANGSQTAAPRPALVVDDIARALRAAIGDQPTTLVRVPNGWSGELWSARHPLDILGADGGEGIASGPGMTIGAALALRGSGRLPVAVLGDGDFVMGANAFWTAAHYGLALLVVVANNRSFFNDEIHQHQVAVRRDRPTANRWIGQHITGPDIDLAAIARAQGLTAHGPATGRAELDAIIAQAVADARAGAAVVVDVRIGSSVEHETARAVTQGGRR
jgi:thiamine pyrophosphate-dependent acetolactate synthase large subunit-like protein